jgi:hypothetical protein
MLVQWYGDVAYTYEYVKVMVRCSPATLSYYLFASGNRGSRRFSVSVKFVS